MSKSYKNFIDDTSVITDKNIAIRNFKEYAINKLLSMFVYENLPETIPANWLEYYLMTNGNCFVTEIKEQDFIINSPDKYERKTGLYAVTGGVGGEYDIYYQPTTYIISNPRLNKSMEKTIDVDGVLIRNDSMMCGLIPILNKYGSLLCEADLTIRVALINMRLTNTISASDDNTKKSAEEFLKKIENGEISVIGNSPFFDGVKQISSNAGLTGYLSQIIEITQYIKASFYNEIGLNANYNLKREYISDSENSLADDVLLPLVDNMLAERQRGIDKINAMYGTNINVKLSSSWETNDKEDEKEKSMSDSVIESERQEESEEQEEPEEQEEQEEQEEKELNT